MEGVLIEPSGKCSIITFPENRPTHALSDELTIDHTTLSALNHRGPFGIFCEYKGADYNPVATKITNLLNFGSKNVDHTAVRGRAVFYKDEADVTPADWDYARRMIKAKRTRVPTKEYKEHLRARLARDFSDDDALLASLARQYDRESAEFWGVPVQK